MAKVIFTVGDDISTDIIYPGRYMATVLPEETPQFAFADNPDFNARLLSLKKNHQSVIVAGENFGCGSSREQAVSTLKGHEVIIVAKSIARIFLQNSVNLGLKIILAPDNEASEDDELEISQDRVLNTTTGKSFQVEPLPKSRREIIEAGGLISYTRARLLKDRSLQLSEIE